MNCGVGDFVAAGIHPFGAPRWLSQAACARSGSRSGSIPSMIACYRPRCTPATACKISLGRRRSIYRVDSGRDTQTGTPTSTSLWSSPTAWRTPRACPTSVSTSGTPLPGLRQVPAGHARCLADSYSRPLSAAARDVLRVTPNSCLLNGAVQSFVHLVKPKFEVRTDRTTRSLPLRLHLISRSVLKFFERRWLSFP